MMGRGLVVLKRWPEPMAGKFVYTWGTLLAGVYLMDVCLYCVLADLCSLL